MTDLLKLAARCEQATGLNRDLNCDIAMATGIRSSPARDPAALGFTGSLDAAMTLVPEGCKEWHCGRNIKTGKGQAYLLDPATMRSPIYVHGETPALALCAAALRARAASADSAKGAIA